MKVNKYIISALVCPFVLGSCADWDDWKYDVEKPQTIAQYEYLNDYAPLKENLDRSAHPGFKVSGALGVDEFNQQGPLFRLAAHNFDEIVAGNAMKMASCVNDQGVMDFSKVSSFVTAAEDAGVSIYGHTLAWHAQQPKKWLEKLIKDKELPPAEENPGLIITSGEPKANPWDYEIYYDLDEPLKAGKTYEISLNVRGTNSGTIDFWPGKKDGSDTQYGAGSFIVSKSAVDNSFSFTPNADIDRMRFCFGNGDLDALSSFGDLIVLTVHAGQIAPGEKDRPRPARPCDARLLPVMKSRAGDHRQHPALAIAKLTLARDALPAHHLARARTQIAYAHFD